MRILQVIPILNPDVLWAGPHRVVYDISRSLARKGHNVTVVTSDVLNVRTRIKINSGNDFDGFDIVRVKNFSTILSRTSGLIITPELNEFLSKHAQDFDLIHIHEYYTYQNTVVRRFSKRYAIPYILQAHGSLRKNDKIFRKWFYDAIFGYGILRDASKVIALSRVEAEQYRRMGVPEEKIAIIPNGIDLSEYAELPPKGAFRKKFNIPEERKIVLYLGRIHKIKGIDFLIKAYAYLVNEMNLKDAVSVIAGPDDGYLSEAKALAHTLGVSDSAMFVGPLYGRNKIEAYVDSDVVVLPSRYETFPMVVLEAYACGKPVIASNVGGLKELIIDGETGLLFKAGNFKQMAEKMVYLLNDSDKAVEISRKGRILVEEKYSIVKVADIIEGLYSEVAL